MPCPDPSHVGMVNGFVEFVRGNWADIGELRKMIIIKNEKVLIMVLI